MKNKSLIISAVLLAVLFSALVFSAIRLFTHHVTPIEPAAVKKSTAAINAPAGKTTQAMIEHSKKSKTRPGKRSVTTPKPDNVKPAPADSKENRFEIARMKKHLAGNMWIPEDPRFGVDPERSERLAKNMMLADKIRKGTATPSEKKEYYSYKIKSAGDRIDIIKYIADRTAQLHKKDKKIYLTDQDRVVGEKKIMQLQKKIKGYKDMLEKIGTETNKNSGK